MTILDRFLDAARARPRRVVFPEAEDARVAEAIARLAAEGACEVVPLAPASEAHVAAVLAVRDTRPALARRMVAKPLIRAAAMVGAGEADAMVAGADSPTKDVIMAATLGIGVAEGVATPSSFFLMVFPGTSSRGGRQMIWADCAVNAYPDAAQLADIARASAATAEALLGTARVAMLSFSTGRSGQGASVEMVREAALATGFTGPVQADAALNPAIAAKKGLGAGDANCLVFPSLDAGNIAYKVAQELAGAQALGPFLQGFHRPVCDLSRGASAEDIYAATLVTLALG